MASGAKREHGGTVELPSALQIVLSGRVQGLGVRPRIALLAADLRLAGCVRNSLRGVEIEIEGAPERLDQFTRRLPHELPAGATLDHLEASETAPSGRTEFEILRESSNGPLTTPVPVDRAVCAECLHEVADPADRRSGYPFTSCTACGPRYTIIRRMPYERSETTMAAFAFCGSCSSEYTGADDRRGRFVPAAARIDAEPPNSTVTRLRDKPAMPDRRFHAQTNACPECGPRVWCVETNRDVESLGAPIHAETTHPTGDAIQIAVQALHNGQIVAVRGLGGYQLLVDATNERAVARLRERKQRPAKPLAVMVRDLASAQRYAFLDEIEQQVLSSPANPIVLARAKSNTGLATSIHPGLDTLGLLLPTTPLHALLLQAAGRPLVCTSGNRDGEPLEFELSEAERRLAGVCDLWLHHDRPIARPVDDSVVRVMAGRAVTIRLARGLAPLPLDLPHMPPTIAVGGHLKSAIAFSNGAQAALGPHVSDLESMASRERYMEEVDNLRRLYRFKSRRRVHDLHPDYWTTEWARAAEPDFATENPVDGLLGVQHHHAHVAAGMLEHGWIEETVMGVAWDGTGYGTDGTIWGGEFLVTGCGGFQRFGHLRPFRLPGGEAAVREPWRTAISILKEAKGRQPLDSGLFQNVNPKLLNRVQTVADRGRYSPLTTSAGRMFDAAAALVLGIERSEYEGQPAMSLEAAADSTATGCYDFPVRFRCKERPLWRSETGRTNGMAQRPFPTDCETGEPAELDWRPLFAGLLDDLRRGVDPGTVALRFHRSVAAGIVAVCRLRPDLPVVLSGGVFQNRLLTELVAEMWPGPQPLGLPGTIPPNDGGLAAGQLAVASIAFTEKR